MSKLAWLGQVTQSHTLCPKEKWTWHPWLLAGALPTSLSPRQASGLSPHCLLGPEVGIYRASASQAWEGPKPCWRAGSAHPCLHPQLCCRGCQMWARSHPLDTPADPREPSPRI